MAKFCKVSEKKVSKITIDSSTDLERFLKILAEESVNAAQQKIAEDAEQEYYETQMKKDKKRFVTSNMTEEDEEVEAEESEEEKPAEKKAKPPTPAESEAEEVTYYKIRDKLNTIRSGKSLKDSDLKAELEQYVDRLSKDERRVLFTFLKSIGDIMTDVASGGSAADPSDPPVSLDVKPTDGAEEKKVSKGSQSTKTSSSSPEDTSAPIKVGRQQTEAIRDIVKNLMLS